MDTKTQRAMVNGQTQWLPADRTEAYGTWRGNGSLAKTAAETGIPFSTVQSWCRREGWVRRKQEEDALEQEMALQRAWTRIVAQADPLITNLLDLAETGTKGDMVRLAATKHALAIIGISPVERRVVTGRTMDRETTNPSPALSDDAIEAIEAMLADGDTDKDGT